MSKKPKQDVLTEHVNPSGMHRSVRERVAAIQHVLRPDEKLHARQSNHIKRKSALNGKVLSWSLTSPKPNLSEFGVN